MNAHPSSPAVRQRGSVLIITLIVVFALVTLVLALGRNARVEAAAARNSLAAAQAQAIAQGAQQYALALLTDRLDTLDQLTDTDFAAVELGDGWFWILRPNFDDPDQPAYGFQDESARLDLNTVTLESLRRMEGMTDELATSIIDWRDGDDDSTEGGAESNFYLTQSPPYRAKNGDFETPHELRLVRGMTDDLYRGAAASGGRTLTTEGWQHWGLLPYFTVWSWQNNVSADGTQRINIASAQQRQQFEERLRQRLGTARANDVLARLGNPRPRDLFDLASRGGMTSEELKLVEDDFTTSSNPRVRGLINVNRAPREVLRTLEAIDESEADQLLEARPEDGENSIAWVWDVLHDAAIGLSAQITGRGMHYSADILAVAPRGRAWRRVRVVIDSGSTPVRVVFQEDLTRMGWPLAQEVLDNIRAGYSPAGGALMGGRS